MSDRVKLKLNRLLEPAFQAAFAKLGQDAAVPKAEAWAVARSRNALNRALSDWKSASSKTAIKHGKPQNPDDPKSPITIPKEAQPAFYAELEGLAEGDVELYLNHPIALPDPLPPTSHLTPDDLSVLLDNGVIVSAEPHDSPQPKQSA